MVDLTRMFDVQKTSQYRWSVIHYTGSSTIHRRVADMVGALPINSTVQIGR